MQECDALDREGSHRKHQELQECRNVMLLDREGSHRKHREVRECRNVMLWTGKAVIESIENCESAGM